MLYHLIVNLNITHGSHFLFSILKGILYPNRPAYTWGKLQASFYFSRLVKRFFPVSFSLKREHLKVLVLWYYWGFLNLFIRDMSLSCFGIRVKLASWNEFARVSFFSIFCKSKKHIAILFWMFGKIYHWINVVFNFCLLRGFDYCFQPLY